MKFASFGIFLSLVTLVPIVAMAKDCGDNPISVGTCRAASCMCGMCSKCKDEKSKYSCEHRDEEEAKALMEYDSCMRENEKSTVPASASHDDAGNDNEQD
jgi:hypothetical protein